MKRRISINVTLDFEDEGEVIDTAALTKDVYNAIETCVESGLILDWSVEREAYLLDHGAAFVSDAPIAEETA